MRIPEHIKHYPLTLTCIAVIWILCLCRPPQIQFETELSFGWDKVAHFLMYAGTCSIIWWEYLRCHHEFNRVRVFTFAFIAPILMSGSIELVQGYATDYRGADWGDVLANALGAFSGNLFGALLLFFKKHKS